MPICPRTRVRTDFLGKGSLLKGEFDLKEVIVQYGGVSLNRLCQQLEENQIHLNAYANQLLRHPQLSFSADKQRTTCVIVSLKELGLTQGGSLTEIFAAAPSYGLTDCTLEMALHLRLIS